MFGTALMLMRVFVVKELQGVKKDGKQVTVVTATETSKAAATTVATAITTTSPLSSSAATTTEAEAS